MAKAIGIDCTGEWTAAQYVVDAGWDFSCIEATANHGIADTDAAGLTEQQQAKLLAYCMDQVRAPE